MGEAFQCDRCGSYADGDPYGLAQLRSRKDGADAELCEECFQMMLDMVSKNFDQ